MSLFDPTKYMNDDRTVNADALLRQCRIAAPQINYAPCFDLEKYDTHDLAIDMMRQKMKLKAHSTHDEACWLG
jgi:hypothetical protein